jgi:hypothetical protein
MFLTIFAILLISFEKTPEKNVYFSSRSPIQQTFDLKTRQIIFYNKIPTKMIKFDEKSNYY